VKKAFALLLLLDGALQCCPGFLPDGLLPPARDSHRIEGERRGRRSLPSKF